MADAGFILSVALLAAIFIGLMVTSHIGARRVAANKAARAAPAGEQPAIKGEAPPPFDLAPFKGALSAAGATFFYNLVLRGNRKRGDISGEVTTKPPSKSSVSYAPRSLAEPDSN